MVGSALRCERGDNGHYQRPAQGNRLYSLYFPQPRPSPSHHQKRTWFGSISALLIIPLRFLRWGEKQNSNNSPYNISVSVGLSVLRLSVDGDGITEFIYIVHICICIYRERASLYVYRYIMGHMCV